MVKIMLDASSDGKKLHPCDYFIPIHVDMDGKSYQDGLDLDAETFYPLLMSSQNFPQTAQPSPETFINVFEKVKADGDELIYLCISSALSGTYQSACIAKDMVEYDGIYVVDTKAATHLIGILARYADTLRNEGRNAQDIYEAVLQLREKVVAYAGLQTLEYLYKGGRLSRASAAIGTMANIKPIITISADGKVDSFAKAIGVKRAIATILKQVQDTQIDHRFPVWTLCTVENENCEALEEALSQAGITVDARMPIGSTIGAHVGPGVYGIVFVKK